MIGIIKSNLSSRLSSQKSSKDALPVVKLEIVSDTVCPFCYLLREQLRAAMAEFKGKLHFEVHWVAYQLQPLAPPEGVSKMAFLEQKFKGQAEYLMQKKGEFFKNKGLQYTNNGVIGNTFNSHRLVAYAAQQSLEKQDEVMGLLFKAFFGEGKHINDKEVLREIAHEAHLKDPDRVIDDTNCCSDVVRWELENKYKDVIGVPHTVVNDGQLRLGGAKDKSVWVKVFQRLLEESSNQRKLKSSSSK